MTKPTPEPVAPEQVLRRALAVVRADRVPYLATADGDQPRLRPVSPVRTDGFTVYVANLRAYHKTVEIAGNPRVELGYLDDRHDQVRITGVAEVIKREFGVAYHPDHVGRLLRAIGWTVQKPREQATQRDDKAIAAWRAEQWPEIKKKRSRKGVPWSG